MARKNPAAVALGRRGGSANTDAQNAARARNAKLGGRPISYRWRAGHMEQREGDEWFTVSPPYSAAVKLWLKRNRPSAL